eukprot:scaffold4342_cov166-Ochromonas_danica.AAC.2
MKDKQCSHVIATFLLSLHLQQLLLTTKKEHAAVAQGKRKILFLGLLSFVFTSALKGLVWRH